jgi:hypothetical protein
MPRFRIKSLLRYLRIVFTAFCGLICVLLIVLFAKSIWCVDCIDRTKSGVYT